MEVIISERIIKYLLSQSDHTAIFKEIHRSVGGDYSQSGLWRILQRMEWEGVVTTQRNPIGKGSPLIVTLVDLGEGGIE